MDKNLRDLILQAMDGSISADDFCRLQDAIEQSDDVRAEYLRAVALTETLSEMAADVCDGSEKPSRADRHQFGNVEVTAGRHRPRHPKDIRAFFVRAAVVAGILCAVAWTAFRFGRGNLGERDRVNAPQGYAAAERREVRLAGHATVRSVVDVEWAAGMPARREGDVLPDGRFGIDRGTAAIDFFCGATLIVEGPAALEIESDWSVRVIEGRIRASVPPAARGFMVKAADSEIVDLGTEFALEVGNDRARVEVIDGEVELNGGRFAGQLLKTGEGRWLSGSGPQRPNLNALSTLAELDARRDSAEQLRFAEWKESSQRLQNDERLIAYYPIAAMQQDTTVRNVASSGTARDGRLVGPVSFTSGRFGGLSSALAFDRPGARVRTRIDGEFPAFTFVCWVRIDSLEHRYNALFMGDGYETGEPHWQIRDDGCLMFSVMVDDTQKIPHFSREEQRMVTRAGLHRVYVTPPFWDISRSGQWFHLAAVYDPANRVVEQFVNGESVSSEEIVDRFLISSLRIGPSEIGNWGQPFRRTPWFAVRNLHGAIDELAVFSAALREDEIQALYEQGKPHDY